MSAVATHYQNSTLQIMGLNAINGLYLLGEAKLHETTENGQPLVSVWLPPEQTSVHSSHSSRAT